MSDSAVLMSSNVDQSSASMKPRAAVCMWFGALFLFLILQCAVGGFVRLSGSGLSIPDWPLINGSLLPPMADSGWEALRIEMQEDYDRLRDAVDDGAIGIGMLQPPPAELSEFKVMFLIEWSHRAIVSFISIIAIACLITAYKHAEVKQRLGRLPWAIIGLIAFQALLGGVLVLTGTNTSMLFIHLAIAAIIIAQTVWCILKLVNDDIEPISAELSTQRKPLKITVHTTVGLVMIQLMLGALVAGSKHHGFSSEWPTMLGGQWIPFNMWASHESFLYNMFDNQTLHQWVHRWFAWVVVAAFIVLFYMAKQSPLSPRLALALKVAGTFIVLQVILGISNVFYSVQEIIIALAHLLMAMFIIVALVIAMFDLKYEPMDEGEAAA